VNGQLAFGLAQDFAKSWRKIETLGSQIELALGDVPCVDRSSDLLGRHRPDTLHSRDVRSEALACGLDSHADGATPLTTRQCRGGFRLVWESGTAGSTWVRV